jgi:UDP-N-acetylmuramoyl-tripeptide--D-alanyl-D-alanine ligase
MISLTLGEIADVVSGQIAGDSNVLVTGSAAVDTRQVSSQGLFVALVGARADGHDFALQAGAAGAAAVLGTRATELPTVVVFDPVAALGRLSRHVLDQASELTTFAITGSQGKTGTKDYLAAILARKGETVATRGNLNNEIGVPLTALGVDVATRFLVVEMGARHVGDIGYLCSVAPPDVAAVVNVGTAHLGEFGSRDAIAQTKGELIEDLPPSGVAVLNIDDPYCLAMRSRTQARVLTFGADGDLRWERLTADKFGRAEFHLVYEGVEHHVRLRGLGRHQVENAAASAAMAVAAGIDLGDVADSLSECELPSRWRMELSERRDGVAIINDAYNANPTSMTAAIDALAQIRVTTGRPTLAVLGEMRELGAESKSLHREIGVHLAGVGIDRLVTVGHQAADILEGANSVAGWKGSGHRTEGASAALEWVRDNISADDVVLVKASRGAALERIAEALIADSPGGTPQ